MEKELEIALQKLELKTSILEPSQNQRHEIMQKLVKYSDWFIDGIDKRKTFSHGTSPNTHNLEIGDDGNKAQNFQQIIEIYKKEVNNHGINAASGGLMGYIPNGGIFSSAIGDFMAAVSNEFAGQYFPSPGK